MTDSSTQVNTASGSAIGHDVNIDQGDFVGRDKIEQHFHYHSNPPSNPSVASQKSIVFIPFPRKSATEFVGRDAELVELHEKLQQSQMVGVRPAAALTGLGGIGKTQLAVEYAYRYQTSYPGGIFWINAADLNGVRSGLVETAERMGLRTDHNTTDNALLAALVKRCQQQPSTLLCFDNAPDAVILWRRLTQELNTATLGAAILITTRRRELPPNMAALDLRRLSDSTVRQLLGTARPDLLTDPDLPRLLERLGGLPLVVSLVANALHNSPDATIADYLAALAQHGEEMVHEELDVHVADYDLYREVYTRTLLPVLCEQWERLCQQPKSEHAQLLLRIAGQLPEAAEIPIARLGLLAGLHDEKVLKPLTSAVNTLWKLALIEELKADGIRLHPLVRDFAQELTSENECASFLENCVRRVTESYSNLYLLEHEFQQRGIDAIMVDLIVALTLIQNYYAENFVELQERLALLLQLIRRESHKYLGMSSPGFTLWRQLLYRASPIQQEKLRENSKSLLQLPLHLESRWLARNDFLEPGETPLDDKRELIVSLVVLDEKRIAYLSSWNTIRIWNLHANLLEQRIYVPSITSNIIVLEKNYIAFASDNKLTIWDLYTGEIKELFSFSHFVTCLAVLDTDYIITCGDDRFEVWNLKTGVAELIFGIHERDDAVYTLITLGHNRIISASDQGVLRIWNLKTCNVEYTLNDFSDDTVLRNTVRITVLNENRIISDFDDCFKIWNLQSMEAEETFSNITPVMCMDSTLLDKNHLITAGYSLDIWNLKTGKIEQTISSENFSGHRVSVASLDIILDFCSRLTKEYTKTEKNRLY